jgi:hypothetical protein
MKRFLIFTVLFPPLVLVVFIVPDLVSDRDFAEIGLLFWMLGFAYLLAVIPAWLTAGVDWALSAKPLYLRLVAALLGPREMSDLSPQSGPKRTLSSPIAILWVHALALLW